MPQVNLLSDVDPTAITLCKQGANRQRIFLKKEHVENPDVTTPEREIIRKADGDDWSVFYCVVAEPGAQENPGLVGDGITPDEWASPEEIQKAAHKLLKNGAYVNGVHDGEPLEGVQIVESAVALADFVVDSPDGSLTTIKKGSWYVAIEPDETYKAQIDSGDIEAISMEAMGYRTLIEKSDKESAIKRALRALTDALSIDAPEAVSAEQQTAQALQKSALGSFEALLAEQVINDSLYPAWWALQDAIYLAFDPRYNVDGTDPKVLIEQSLTAFQTYVGRVLDGITPEAQTALHKEAGTLRDTRPAAPQEDDDTMTDEQFEALKKSQDDTAAALTALAKALGKDPANPDEPKEPVKKADEVPTDVAQALTDLKKQVEDLAAGGSSQREDDDKLIADFERIRKEDPERADAMILLGG